MLQPSVIAIDGPAGAGKSTLGALLANQLGYLYFDTGVMYRALALVALQAKLDLHDEAEMARLAYEVQIEVAAPITDDGRQYTVLVNGEDVTWAIRSPEVERNVSLVARYPQVRREMVRQQQQIGRRGNTVMVGRDIGTIVMPDADLKIFLEASLQERARRRAVERDDDPDQTVMAQIQQDLARRDQLDDHVLKPADDAVILQTDGLSPDDELAWILDYLAGHHNG
ncbi:(d)CMP kinase [Candidatus Chloroploca sp. M-50]|uniref:Cytidylate kinase n=1 Tax=Candidatus Chloroploca mongolica TaxID=2528176 RepID=A0ABS4DFD0_9CHLR|nr:(d)CMP kinase [Candidatus Chloroploca mongolica]MBP1468143.1 (d)CMP kinase [Candidatus Chloroploca mongolica]